MPPRPSSTRQPSGFDILLSSEDGRIDRLVLAAAQQIAERGLASATARSIAAAAGCAPSAINYNFGNLEQLLSTAFDLGQVRARAWLAERAREITALPPTRAGAPLALEHLIVQWTGAARPLALLYQEDLAARQEAASANWATLWRDFWLETAPRFELSEADGRLLHLIFETEALYHLSAWSPALEPAALREICGHLGEVWLDAGPAAPRGALALAERAAGVITAQEVPPAAAKIAEAAASVIDTRGLAGLTHRAVAAQAGLTTGAVTHHFRTIEDLVAGAIRGQVLVLARRSAGPSGAPIDQVATPEEFSAIIRRLVVEDRDAVSRIDRRGLFLAAVRRPEMASAGAVIRFAHGATTRGGLARAFDLKEPELTLTAGLVSRLLSSLPLGCAGEASPQAVGMMLVDQVLGRLAKPSRK
jgi:AcrR family transcriptional regulator